MFLHFFYSLFVGFCAFDETAAPPSFGGEVLYRKMNFIFQSDLSFCLRLSHLCDCPNHLLCSGGSQYLRVCQDCHYPKGKISVNT